MASFDLSLGLHDTHVLVTGGSGQIGNIVVHAFLSAGCFVSSFDLKRPGVKHEKLDHYDVDISGESIMLRSFAEAISRRGLIAVCVALAGLDLSFIPQHKSLCDMPLVQWQRTHRVNVEGTFLTCREWLKGVRDHAKPDSRNLSLIIIGSEAGSMGCKGNADYSAGKAAVQYGLVKSLVKDVVEVHPRARVNAIAPGPVDTLQFRTECENDPDALWLEAQATVALKSPTPVDTVARSILFLASERWSSHITGQMLSVNGGKTGKLCWQKEELV